MNVPKEHSGSGGVGNNLTGSASPVLEALEERTLLSVAYPTIYDQYLLELVNRARANPAGEAVLHGIDLNEGLTPGTITTDAKQPLAPNVYLMDSAQSHSLWMLTNDVFGHTGVGGTDPSDRMAIAGYSFTGFWGWGENIAWYGEYPQVPNRIQTTAQLHRDLFVDSVDPNRGHRINLMHADFKELGTGVRFGEYSGYNAVMVTEDFAYSGTSTFLTGVAYDDDLVTDDDFYSPGEELSGVTITAVRQSDGATYQVNTWFSGGYTLALPAGTYDVTATDSGLGGTVEYNDVVIASENVKLDFTPDLVVTDPDLTVSDAAYPSGIYYPLQNLYTSVDMLNDGASAGAFYYQVRLSTDQTWGDADDVVLGSQYISTGLGAGASDTSDVFVELPEGLEEGTYYVGVKIDSTAAVSESNESNNIWWSTSADIRIYDVTRYFVEDQYLAMYTDVGIAVSGGYLESGYQHYVNYGIPEGRDPSMFFSEQYYRARYPDIAAAVDSGAFGCGLEHFFLYGTWEGRDTLFNEQRYLTMYPDVAAAVAGGSFVSGFQHYISVGAAGGRDGPALYQESYYRAKYSDVEMAVQLGSFTSGLEHFIWYGRFEGRSPSFDEQEYLDTYTDVRDAVDNAWFACGFDHYILYGRFEGREGFSFFDEDNYLTTYSDVQNAINLGYFDSGIQHYILYGQYEGRHPNP